jgi:hypothetical protein
LRASVFYNATLKLYVHEDNSVLQEGLIEFTRLNRKLLFSLLFALNILPLSNKEILEESVGSMDEKPDFQRAAPESVALRTGGWKTSPYILGT